MRSYSVINTTEEQLVYLFTLQTNKLLLFYNYFSIMQIWFEIYVTPCCGFSCFFIIADNI